MENRVQNAIYRISEATLSAHDLDELYAAIHAIISELMPADNFHIALYDPKEDLFHIPYVRDEFNDPWPPFKPGHGLGAYVLRTGKPLLVTPERFSELEQAGEVVVRKRRMTDWLGVPLRTQQGIIGLMAVQTYGETGLLNQAHQDILVFVSNQVAMAIERKQAEQELIETAAQNALLHQQVQRYANELEQRVAERTAQLEAANKELEAFSYSVSHDLRGPLRAIDGYSRILLADYSHALEPDAQEVLNRIVLATRRMGQLIDDLLKLSRLTRQEMSYAWVDLSSLAHEVVEQLQQQEPQRQVEISITDGLTAFGDLQLLRIVLENLLGNAWKFTRLTTPARIEFGAAWQDGQPTFFIRDNGAGFDMRYVERLFNAFQRLHPSDEFEGNGIGLATIQRIIQRHGGRVWAEGEVGRGAVFYFQLP